MEQAPVKKEEKFGVLLKMWASRESDLPNRLQLAHRVIERVMEHVPKEHLAKILILVWNPQQWYSTADCGMTCEAMRHEFANNPLVDIREVSYGDCFTVITNMGLRIMAQANVDWTLVLSPEVATYVTTNTFQKMLEATRNGAKAIGVAIGELQDSIKKGRLASTFAAWHTASCIDAGGFGLPARMRRDDDVSTIIRVPIGNGHAQYGLHGVEETTLLAMLVELFGRCIAPILPDEDDTAAYEIPDQNLSPELYERHTQKMALKEARQAEFLRQVGRDFAYLKSGVMNGYPS